jgi:hypothetical protein
MISAPLLKALLRRKFIDDENITEEKIESIQENDYQTKGLGKFLEEHFEHLQAKVRSDKGETLANYYKTKLANETSKHLTEIVGGNDPNAAWNLLSDEAKALAKAIDAFIRKHNPRVSV